MVMDFGLHKRDKNICQQRNYQLFYKDSTQRSQRRWLFSSYTLISGAVHDSLFRSLVTQIRVHYLILNSVIETDSVILNTNTTT
jgi:hypothetical protein